MSTAWLVKRLCPPCYVGSCPPISFRILIISTLVFHWLTSTIDQCAYFNIQGVSPRSHSLLVSHLEPNHGWKSNRCLLLMGYEQIGRHWLQ